MRDTELQRLVLEELDWDPKVDASEVGVTVEEGIVTLTGDLGSYAERYACLEAAKRVRGVKAVVEDLRVHVARAHARPDEELARRVLETLRWHVSVPDERIKPTVEDGWVVLDRAGSGGGGGLVGPRSHNGGERAGGRGRTPGARAGVRLIVPVGTERRR